MTQADSLSPPAVARADRSSGREMRTVIAESCPKQLERLTAALRGALPAALAVVAPSLEDTVQVLASSDCALLIWHEGLGEPDGPAAVLALKEAYPDLRIVVVVDQPRRATVLQYLGCGAQGVMASATPFDRLTSGLQRVAAGEIDIPAMIAHEPLAAEPAGAQELTKRQAEVLGLLQAGRSTKEIARTLDLGIGTVKVHLAGIYRALAVSNRVDAITKAQRLRLVP